MNEERGRGKYTLEFKQEPVRQVKAGRAAPVVAKTLAMPKASLTNWVRAEAKGQLGRTAEGKPAPVVTPEQAELARLRAEVVLHFRLEAAQSKRASNSDMKPPVVLIQTRHHFRLGSARA